MENKPKVLGGSEEMLLFKIRSLEELINKKENEFRECIMAVLRLTEPADKLVVYNSDGTVDFTCYGASKKIQAIITKLELAEKLMREVSQQKGCACGAIVNRALGESRQGEV